MSAVKAGPSETLSPWRLAGMYMGTVVGAGFASGQEVLQFFGFHGLYGILGILVSSALFVIYGAVVMITGRRIGAESHREVVLAGGIPWATGAVDILITCFLLGTFSAMAAGSGAIFEEQFGVPALLGSGALAAVAVATVLLGISGVVTALSLFSPLLLATVIVVSLVAFSQSPADFTWSDPARAALSPWPVAAVAYASYNLVFAIAILAPAGTLGTEAALRRGALYGGIGLGLGALAIHVALLTRAPAVTRFEIPMIHLATQTLGPFSLAYSVILLAEVYTTSVACLYGFVARLAEQGSRRYRLFAVGSGIAGFAASLVGFSNLVSKVYSAVGVAGLLLLVTLIVGYRKTAPDSEGARSP